MINGSWRFQQAGADQVLIAAPDKLAHIRRLEQELSLEEVLAQIAGVDLILTEGYKRGPLPKVEVSRSERSRELLCSEEELFAIVSDQRFPLDVPQFALDDVGGLADLIESRLLREITT